MQLRSAETVSRSQSNINEVGSVTVANGGLGPGLCGNPPPLAPGVSWRSKLVRFNLRAKMRYRTSTYLYRVKFLFEISEAVKKNYGCRAKTYQLFEFLTKNASSSAQINLHAWYLRCEINYYLTLRNIKHLSQTRLNWLVAR